MPKSLKFPFIVFLVCSLTTFHKKSLAAAQPDTITQTFNDDTAVDKGSDKIVYSDHADALQEAAFDKTTTLPAPVKRELNDQEWNRITRDPDYKYDDGKEPKPKEPVDYSKSWWVRMFQGIFEFFSSTIGSYLLIFIVVTIVLILIARVIQLNGNIFFSKKDKKIGQTGDENSDDYVPENWDAEITAAAKAGNFRLALRHCYRYLLNTLNEKEFIQFQVAKTNYQYVYELSGTPYHQPFMKLTRDYEYAWYGGFEINEDFYRDYYQMAQTIQQQLKH
jgi:hypothetical protein